MLEGIELEHNGQDARQDAQQDDPQHIERVEAIGGMLRLLQADGSILEVYYPAQLQCDSDDTDDSDNNEGNDASDNNGDTVASDNNGDTVASDNNEDNDASDNNDNRGDSNDDDDNDGCDGAEIAPDFGDMIEEV